MAVVDAGPLYAALDRDDRDHAACASLLRERNVEWIVPALVVTEVVYFAGQRLGSEVEARFVDGLSTVGVQSPTSDDWKRIGQLVRRYASLPLGTVDASVAVLADRLGTDLIFTLDRRHFSTLRTARGKPFKLLPEI